MYGIIRDTDRNSLQQSTVDTLGQHGAVGGALEEASARACIVHGLERDALADWVVELLVRDGASTNTLRKAPVGQHACVDVRRHNDGVAENKVIETLTTNHLTDGGIVVFRTSEGRRSRRWVARVAVRG